ncbi:MAG: 16S rRNA (cytidine(1402)-2'-O)-methyltransferase [Ruminococcaceae bacterium]|nr:16S rRNA (cytidine(1402)-2'-O)-methyltransferase [Oscillospiraceae bacterium]
MAGKLYIVGTPIGNLEDFSPRAKRILSEVDFIAAEDTRVTVKLLNHLGISKPMVAYFEHNKKERGNTVIERMLSGEVCAIVTDAGMPAISDPGEDLIRECHERGIAVESVPGPTAFATALALSGMPSGRFCFEGFLSVNKPSRKKHLEEVKTERRTLIFYEAPHKLIRTLVDMYEVFGDRNVAIVREITKIHETVMRTSFSEAIEFYKENEPRGEYVLIIEGAKEETVVYCLDDAVKLAKRLINDGLSASAAAKEAANVTGIKKSEIYKTMLG